jgi:hypothetical protein
MRFGNIEISDKRFRDITFRNAKKACEILGDAWRLPTELELDALFYFLNELGPDRRVGQFVKDDKPVLYWTDEGSIIDDTGSTYRIMPSFLSDVCSIMVRDI